VAGNEVNMRSCLLPCAARSYHGHAARKFLAELERAFFNHAGRLTVIAVGYRSVIDRVSPDTPEIVSQNGT
jgi:hypothetical protein